MAVRLMDGGWWEELQAALDGDVSTVRIASPFIKHGAVDGLLPETGISLRVLTRFNLDHFRDGVSDIAETLADPEASPAVRAAVFEGHGDAQELLGGLASTSSGGTPLFPMLGGPKIGPMWVRILAYPGGAQITSLEALPVAADVQVRKVSEYLGMTDTGGLDLETARPLIQATWAADVEAHGAAGPEPLGGTAAALDPALWFYGKWGCTRCERAKRRSSITPLCARCTYATH